jgi:plastocyanin
MWFPDKKSNSIGKITPTGSVTEYPVPGFDSEPFDIVAGPDGNLWATTDTFISTIEKITTAGVVTQYSSYGSDYSVNIAAGPDGNLYVCSGYSVWQVTTAGVITQHTTSHESCGDIILGPDKKMWMTLSPENQGGLVQKFDPKTQTLSTAVQIDPSSVNLLGLTLGSDGDVWFASSDSNSILAYEDKLNTIGIRLNGEMSLTDPNYGFELGYSVGRTSTQTQTISLSMGESVRFKNVDTEPHSAAFLGNATGINAPWPGSFNGSTTQSPAGTAIGTTGWATGSLNPNKTSPIYETGQPGFYMIGCQYHYNSNEMRTVIVVH